MDALGKWVVRAHYREMKWDAGRSHHNTSTQSIKVYKLLMFRFFSLIP